MYFLSFNEIVIDMLLYRLDEKTKKTIKILKKKDLIHLHKSLGEYICKEYKLWDKDNPLTLKDYQPQIQTRRRVQEVEINGKTVILEVTGEEEIDINPKHPNNVCMKIIEAIWEKLQ